MRRLTATDAARGFADLLDAVERDGESFVVVRHGREVATISPAATAAGKRLKGLLAEHRADPDWADDLRALRDAVGSPPNRWNA